MQKNGCKFAILECTSEGLAQNRHYGINFDAALLTNISPAHLDVHGGFELYKKAKLKLFARMLQLPKKAGKVKKMIGVNLDNLQAVEFLAFPAEVKFGISLHPHPQMGELQVYGAEHIKLNEGLNFEVRGAEFQLKLIGEFNVYNALMAAACANILGVTLPNCAAALAKFTEPAGRMEEINSGRGFRIFVDYAPEPAGMQAALLALSAQPHKRLIHVFGATGGHRDVAKRFEFGKISAGFADYLIITNDDVYDSDPKKVARDIVAGINRLKNKEFQMKHYEVILDRRQAIAHALSIARVGDIILFTGKGSEQFLVLPGNHRVVWDEREVVREEIKKLSKT
jgi:UDP-N-acetylmuramoyl-L-alanyl-D-glutamate--2,6-diaminopimelate ligase